MSSRQKAKARAASLDGFGGVTEEDLYQSGFFALLHAVKAFDPESGYAFITYLTRPLKTVFAETAGYRTERRKKDPLHRCVELDVPVGEDDGGETMGDMIADPAAENAFVAVEDGQLRGLIWNAVEQLPEAQKRAIVARYFLGRSLSQEELKAEKEAIKALRHPRISKDLRVFC